MNANLEEFFTNFKSVECQQSHQLNFMQQSHSQILLTWRLLID